MTEEINCTDCMYIDGNYCPNHDTKCDFVDCYYKQLKRLEQERDRLDKLSDELHDRCITLARRYQEARDVCKDLKEERDDLKQENERLKKDIRLYDCVSKWGEKECHCACRCLGNEFCIDADKRINKYKSALEEIRKIILRDNAMIIDRVVYFELQCGEPVTLKLQKIYEKINEVLK